MDVCVRRAYGQWRHLVLYCRRLKKKRWGRQRKYSSVVLTHCKSNSIGKGWMGLIWQYTTQWCVSERTTEVIHPHLHRWEGTYWRASSRYFPIPDYRGTSSEKPASLIAIIAWQAMRSQCKSASQLCLGETKSLISSPLARTVPTAFRDFQWRLDRSLRWNYVSIVLLLKLGSCRVYLWKFIQFLLH